MFFAKLYAGSVITVGELYNIIKKELSHLSVAASIDFLSFLTGIDRDLTILNAGKIIEISHQNIDSFKKVKSGYPVSYLRGVHNFFGYNFLVNEHVLVPRVETEVLVESVLNRTKNIKFPKILDLCTGSGCILISLLNEIKTARGVGVDLSLDALKVADLNVKQFSLENRCSLVQADVLFVDNIFNDEFDIITMNPPYVGINDEHEEFLKFEPDIALFAPEEGLYFYKKMLFKLDKLCKRGGLIFFEIGSNQEDGLRDIYKHKQIEFVEDYFGNKRVMIWKN